MATEEERMSVRIGERTRWAVLCVAAALVLVAAGPGAPTAAAARPPALSGSITVSAAASLTEAFNKIGADFQKQNKKATVTFNFGSSSTLVTQIQSGAPADVFASADLTNMDKLVTTGKVTASPTV